MPMAMSRKLGDLLPEEECVIAMLVTLCSVFQRSFLTSAARSCGQPYLGPWQ